MAATGQMLTKLEDALIVEEVSVGGVVLQDALKWAPSKEPQCQVNRPLWRLAWFATVVRKSTLVNRNLHEVAAFSV